MILMHWLRILSPLVKRDWSRRKGREVLLKSRWKRGSTLMKVRIMIWRWKSRERNTKTRKKTQWD